MAYLGFGRGLPPEEVRELSIWATEGLLPDVVVLLTVSAEVAERRLGGASDRIEDAGADFHRRVAEGFRSQADADPARWVIVDGGGSKAEVAAAVWDAVTARLGWPA